MSESDPGKKLIHFEQYINLNEKPKYFRNLAL